MEKSEGGDYKEKRNWVLELRDIGVGREMGW